MDHLDKLLSALPKNKLRRRADFKIKFRLYRLIFLNKLETAFDFSALNKGWAVAFAVLLVISTTSVYAYASDDVVPGNQLYPLKIAIEKIEQKIAVTPAAKIETYNKLSARRLQEAVVLSEKNPNSSQTKNIKKNIEAEVINQAAILDRINKLDDRKKIESLISAVKENDKKKIDYLEKIDKYAKDNKNEEIIQKVNEAKEAISHQRYNNEKENDNSDDKNKEDLVKQDDEKQVEEVKQVETQGRQKNENNHN